MKLPIIFPNQNEKIVHDFRKALSEDEYFNASKTSKEAKESAFGFANKYLPKGWTFNVRDLAGWGDTVKIQVNLQPPRGKEIYTVEAVLLIDDGVYPPPLATVRLVGK